MATVAGKEASYASSLSATRELARDTETFLAKFTKKKSFFSRT